jgi:hypothetical protein
MRVSGSVTVSLLGEVLLGTRAYALRRRRRLVNDTALGPDDG